jgi:hypothetical protein
MTTFKQFMIDTYDTDDLKAIAEHGCASAAPHKMIYYVETSELYNLHCDELHEVLGNWVDDIGFLPEYILENIGNAHCFKNSVVWAIAEYYANDILCEVEGL